MFSCPLIRFSGVLYNKLVKYERLIFLLFLLIALFQVWHTRFVPSLDGPQHLYNANVLAELIKGNELVGSYFKVNDMLVGYWAGHFFLTLFKLFLPAWLAEKMVLTLYIVGFVFSFRYLVKSLNPDRGNFILYLSFPFVFHFYFAMGYYSFSIAAIFFFLAFGYWIRHEDKRGFRYILIFGLLTFSIFLSHAFVFVLFGMAFLLYLLGGIIHDKLVFDSEKWIRNALLKLFKAAVAVLPAIVFWVIYIRSVMEVNDMVTEGSSGTAELIRFILRIRPLVGFHHQLESPAYILLFAVIALLVLIFLFQFITGLRQQHFRWPEILSRKNLWISVALIFLGCYFFAPDRISAGNLTHRFGLFLFFAVIVWLSTIRFPREIHMITLVLVLVSFVYARKVHHDFIGRLNDDVQQIRELSAHVEPNTVMHYQRTSPNWLHRHFPLYVAVDQPVVHLMNQQCRGQFPVEWNLDALPRSFADSSEIIPSGAIMQSDRKYKTQNIDYVVVFRDDLFWNDSTNQNWIRILQEHYEEVAVSSGGRASLWRN